MPFVEWTIRGSSSVGNTAVDSNPKLMLSSTKKRLTRPYSSSHINASLRRLDRDVVTQRSRTAVRRTTTAGSPDGGIDGRIWLGSTRAASAGLLRVSPVKACSRSAECKSVNDVDDELEIDYRKIEDEDLDRMTESDVYQRVRKLHSQNYEHESLRGGISPSIVQASKRLQASKHAGGTVVRIGSKYHDGLKVKGVPIEVKTNSQSKDEDEDENEDAHSGSSVSSEDICLCHSCRNRQSESDQLSPQNGKHQNAKTDASTIKMASHSRVATSIKRPCTSPKDTKRKCSQNQINAQEREDKNKKMPLSRCNSAKSEVFSPAALHIDSSSLSVVAPRSITGPRMRYEVVSSLGKKTVEDDRGSVSSESDIDLNLNKQIETVARAQDIADHRPNADEQTPEHSEVQIFSWRPALKDILHSRSVSLRRRSADCLYADSTSSTKCLKHGRQCLDIPRTMQGDFVGESPSAQVWSRGRRLKISIDMRSIRLPPIISYTQHNPRSVDVPSTSCAACVTGVTC